ncbi:MAG: hypothetical protein NT160_06430 [Actinobacteria bacterium]|nr:hypothetical protein [Actinomycetota bacterium]
MALNSLAEVLSKVPEAVSPDLSDAHHHLAALSLEYPTIVDRFKLAQCLALKEPDSNTFAWSPRNAQRTIALGALRRCLAGSRTAPLDAVLAELERLAIIGRRDPVDWGSLPHFLAHCSEGARAEIVERASSLATSTLLAVPWRNFTDRPIFGEQIGPLRIGKLSLKAKIDLELTHGSSSTLLLIAQGNPTPRAIDELAYVAALAALDPRRQRPVLRVLFWWPSTGKVQEVLTGSGALTRGVNAIIEALNTRHLLQAA